MAEIGAIRKWELEHGIIRQTREGVEYVVLVNPALLARKCAEDEARYKRAADIQALEDGAKETEGAVTV